MKHDPSEWTQQYPFINGTLCDSNGNEVRSMATSGCYRCADTLPSETGDYNIFCEMSFSAVPLYMSFDGHRWVNLSTNSRGTWWLGGKPDSPLYELSGDGPIQLPPDLSIAGRLASYKRSKIKG